MRRFSAFQIFQDPTAMMQQLLTTSRQLTLGAYKHETECMYSYIQHCFKKTKQKGIHKFWVTFVFMSVRFSSRWTGAEDQGETGSGKEENKPRDRGAERQTQSQQREHQPP